MSDWKVGDRVQTAKDNSLRAGVVTAVDTHEVERTRYSYDYYRSSNSRKEEKYMETEILSIDVKWDDGEEQKGMKRWDVYTEDSEMERTFRLAVMAAHARIDVEMEKAWSAIKEAVKISEETGIPFNAGISPLSQSYIPNSMKEKFPDVDGEFANTVTEAYGEYDGWQHSAVC